MNVYCKVKELADQKKMSIAELERKLEFSQGSVRKWNTSIPGVDKVTKVAEYFDITTDYLLDREPYEILREDEKAKIILEHLDEYLQVNWGFEKHYIKAIKAGLKEIKEKEKRHETSDRSSN